MGGRQDPRQVQHNEGRDDGDGRVRRAVGNKNSSMNINGYLLSFHYLIFCYNKI